MSEQDWIVKFILPGVDLAQKEAREGETLKHLQGKHNQKRHGWRYSGNQVANARSAMRGQTAEERAEYRKRAGMPTPKKIEKPKVEVVKKPNKQVEITIGSEKQIAWAKDIRAKMVPEAKKYVSDIIDHIQNRVKTGMNTKEQYDLAQKLYNKAVRMIANQSKANYYINRRFTPMAMVIEELIKPMPEYTILMNMFR